MFVCWMISLLRQARQYFSYTKAQIYLSPNEYTPTNGGRLIWTSDNDSDIF